MAHAITTVGLGNYGINNLPLGIYRFSKTQDKVYVRMLDHPVIESLQDELTFQSFGHVYEAYNQFKNVYTDIVAQLVEAANEKDIVYTVPGYPRVAETTTVKLLALAKDNTGIDVKVLGGKSFIDDVFEAVNVDSNGGSTLLGTTPLQEVTLNARTHTSIMQIYSAMAVTNLKIILTERYPDDYPVQIVIGVQSDDADNVVTCPLYELDHDENAFNDLTSVFVPKTVISTYLYHDFDFVAEVIDALVGEDKGCPWDKV